MGGPRIGDIVRHPAFGEGQVIVVKEGKVDVAFAPGKIHTILVCFLERIGHEPLMRHTPQPQPPKRAGVLRHKPTLKAERTEKSLSLKVQKVEKAPKVRQAQKAGKSKKAPKVRKA